MLTTDHAATSMYLCGIMLSCTRNCWQIHPVCCRQELAAAIATDGLLPLTKSDTPASFAALLKACWSVNPSDRPSAQDMLQSLTAMQAEDWACDADQADEGQTSGVTGKPLPHAGS